jgi:hypothetical protein
MTEFEVLGPYSIPLERHGSTRLIPKDLKGFWETTGVGDRCGVYVFGIRAGRGIVPIYVGAASRRFCGEAFQAHKQTYHYTPAIAKNRRGTPVMFFVVWPESRRMHSQKSQRMILELEKFLIQTGVVRNPRLSNIRDRGEKRWGIRGVVGGAGKRPNKSEQSFAKLMGIKKT